MATSEAADDVPEDLAIHQLMIELIRSARVITLVSDQLLDRQELNDPTDTDAVAVIRRMIEVATPVLLKAGLRDCLKASNLIEEIRTAIVLDQDE